MRSHHDDAPLHAMQQWCSGYPSSNTHIAHCTHALEPLNLINFFSEKVHTHASLHPNKSTSTHISAMRDAVRCHFSNELWIPDELLRRTIFFCCCCCFPLFAQANHKQRSGGEGVGSHGVACLAANSIGPHVSSKCVYVCMPFAINSICESFFHRQNENCIDWKHF